MLTQITPDGTAPKAFGYELDEAPLFALSLCGASALTVQRKSCQAVVCLTVNQLGARSREPGARFYSLSIDS